MSLCTETGTRPHIHACTRSGPRAQMCTTEHRHVRVHSTPDSPSQWGPGEPAQQDGSCAPVPASQAAAGQPSSSGSHGHARRFWEEALAASHPSSPCHSGAQPCPSGADPGPWVSPFSPRCLVLGWAALPWSQGPCALLSSRGPALPCRSWVQGGSAVCVPSVSSIRPDLSGSQAACLSAYVSLAVGAWEQGSGLE